VKSLGFDLGEAELNQVFEEFKALADRKKALFDGDIEALVLRADGGAGGPWSLLELKTVSESVSCARASVRLSHSDGRIAEETVSGDGPVDAAFKAISTATGLQVTLRRFDVRGLTQGEDAQGEAVVLVEHHGRIYRGSSVSTNIVESGTQAFLEVINRIELTRQTMARGGSRQSHCTEAQTRP
jgi:2-isopropylmalate synthase